MKDGITKSRILEKDINAILKGITDVIKIYNADYTISFFNDAAYNFYGKKPEEVIGKMCYTVLGRTQRCKECPFDKVAKTKQMLVTERYIPELNKFMDVCFNPILDESGEIVQIVERLRDITENKILANMLKESEGSYRQIVNNALYPLIIIQDNKIVLANSEAGDLVGVHHDEIIGENFSKFVPKQDFKTIYRRFSDIIKYKKTKATYEYEMMCADDEKTYFQVSASYICYQNKASIICAIRDMSETKKELNRAAEFQRNALLKHFPLSDKLDIAGAYVPAHKVSGDFYKVHEVDDNMIVGSIIDVSGKGITAALSISGFSLLFEHEISETSEPIEIVRKLNKRLGNYSEETYIASCCFSIDVKRHEIRVVGAGINRFIIQKKNKSIEVIEIEGAFLGMFEDSDFDEKIIRFEPGDRVFFFSDGFDFVLDEDAAIKGHMESDSVFSFTKYIEKHLNDLLTEKGKLMDDCTVLAIEMK